MTTADLLTLRLDSADAVIDAVNEYGPAIADANVASLHAGYVADPRGGRAVRVSDHWERSWYVVDRDDDGTFNLGAAFRHFALDYCADAIDRELARRAA